MASKQTNFEAVGEFNETFGHPRNYQLQKDIFEKDPATVKLRLNLILEEVEELKEAVQNHDMKEVVDALGDILYVVYGMGQVFGINLDEVFNKVHQSNMSKLCRNEQEALETIEYYKTLPGFETTNVGYRLATDGKNYVIYNIDTGKILKSKYFKLPDFTNILQ